MYSVDGIDSSLKSLCSWTKVQFGISSISSVLKAQGHEIKLLVLGSDKWKDSINMLESYMEEFEPGLVAYSAVFSQYPFIEKIAGYVRSQWPGKFAIIGGVHATLDPEEVIKGPFDALCVGEGEFPLLELCNQLQEKKTPHTISNLWFKSAEGAIVRNKPVDFIQNLDLLPFSDRDIWKPWIQERLNDEMTILVGRGCPYDCTYCSNHAIRKTAGGKYVRMRSPGSIISEIALLYESFPHRNIFLEAETLVLDKRWILEFSRQLEAFNSTIGNAISYGCNFRVSAQSLDERIFTALEKANFSKINIGLESGSERVRSTILKRSYSNDDFLKAVAMARKHKLKVNVYNLIGIPGESLSDHMETVRVNRECRPDALCTSIFYPYPGTELYNICVNQGLISGTIKNTGERRRATLDLPKFSRSQIQTAYRRFERRVYKGRYPLWLSLLLVLNGRILSKVRNTLLYNIIINLPGLSHFREKVRKRINKI